MTQTLTIIDETKRPHETFLAHESHKGDLSWISFPTGELNLVIGMAIVKPGQSLTPHIHGRSNDAEIYATLDGTLHIPRDLNPDNIPIENLQHSFLEAGEVALIPPKTIHGMYCPSDSPEPVRVLWGFAEKDFTKIEYDYPDKAPEDHGEITFVKQGSFTQKWAEHKTPLCISKMQIPPGSEINTHTADYAQVFAVIADGSGTICTETETADLTPTQHIIVHPGQDATIKNNSNAPLDIVQIDAFAPGME